MSEVIIVNLATAAVLWAVYAALEPIGSFFIFWVREWVWPRTGLVFRALHIGRDRIRRVHPGFGEHYFMTQKGYTMHVGILRKWSWQCNMDENGFPLEGGVGEAEIEYLGGRKATIHCLDIFDNKAEAKDYFRRMHGLKDDD